MSLVEQVALWAGLISSIISIVLSIFAIVFAMLVDRSARQVTVQTIKSLQKIESEVERSSSDTRDLIKAAWDKMLGTLRSPSPGPLEGSAKEIAAGVTAELRAELKALGEAPGASEHRPPEARLNEVLARLKEELAAQIRAESTPDTPGAKVEQARVMLEGLSPEAKALASEISGSHISPRCYKDISTGPLASALRELRVAGVLAPLQGVDKEGNEVAVYWYPSRLARAFGAAASLVTPPAESARDAVKAELKRVGYYED